jgi:hypothetical protein
MTDTIITVAGFGFAAFLSRQGASQAAELLRGWASRTSR